MQKSVILFYSKSKFPLKNGKNISFFGETNKNIRVAYAKTSIIINFNQTFIKAYSEKI